MQVASTSTYPMDNISPAPPATPVHNGLTVATQPTPGCDDGAGPYPTPSPFALPTTPYPNFQGYHGGYHEAQHPPEMSAVYPQLAGQGLFPPEQRPPLHELQPASQPHPSLYELQPHPSLCEMQPASQPHPSLYEMQPASQPHPSLYEMQPASQPHPSLYEMQPASQPHPSLYEMQPASQPHPSLYEMQPASQPHPSLYEMQPPSQPHPSLYEMQPPSQPHPSLYEMQPASQPPPSLYEMQPASQPPPSLYEMQPASQGSEESEHSANDDHTEEREEETAPALTGEHTPAAVAKVTPKRASTTLDATPSVAALPKVHLLFTSFPQYFAFTPITSHNIVHTFTVRTHDHCQSCHRHCQA